MAEDLQSKAAELMKKVLTVGVGALFLTEESLRALVSEFKLPKELLAAVLDSAAKTKNDFLRTLSTDVISRVADKVDPAAVLQELLTKNEVELSIRFKLHPRPAGAAKASDQGNDSDELSDENA